MGFVSLRALAGTCFFLGLLVYFIGPSAMWKITYCVARKAQVAPVSVPVHVVGGAYVPHYGMYAAFEDRMMIECYVVTAYMPKCGTYDVRPAWIRKRESERVARTPMVGVRGSSPGKAADLSDGGLCYSSCLLPLVFPLLQVYIGVDFIPSL